MTSTRPAGRPRAEGRARPSRVVISGASAGLGRALALRYAAPGVGLVLIARNRERLAQVADTCRGRGAVVEILALDVRERDGLSARLREADAVAPIDLVIANAGVALPETDAAAVHDVVEINLGGALNTVLPLLPAMVERGRGQVAFVSSIAALLPLADAAAYSASKAALVAYGAALREKLGPAGIRVSVVCPGFVATGMGSRYQGSRPFEMSAEAAARRIAAALERDRGLVAFPMPLVLAARAAALLPERLRRWGTAGFRFSIERGALERDQG